jgi:hypothetical protein
MDTFSLMKIGKSYALLSYTKELSSHCSRLASRAFSGFMAGAKGSIQNIFMSPHKARKIVSQDNVYSDSWEREDTEKYILT